MKITNDKNNNKNKENLHIKENKKNVENKNKQKINKILEKIKSLPKKLSKYYLIIKIFTLLLLIIIIIIYLELENKFLTLKDITKKENFITKTKALKSGRKYLDICLEGLLINNQIFNISNNPKVSVIIPLYNTGKRIKFITRSIQNQNIKDIEIILVNDFSNDNTLEIIQKLKEEDPRIQIINNAKNMGTLYSRSIAVLKAKGEYIMNLDHDDMVFDEDVINTAYKSSENRKFDIIAFMHFNGDNYNSSIHDIRSISSFIPHNQIVLQPELSIYTMFKNDRFAFFDYRIWEKLFKNQIYKKSVNFLGYKRYSVFNTYNEDIIGLFIICNIAQSYKYIRKYGVFHLNDYSSASDSAGNELRIFNDLFFSEIILDTAKIQHKKYAAVFFATRVHFYDKNNSYLINVFNKIMNSKYIEEKYKIKLKEKYGIK